MRPGRQLARAMCGCLGIGNGPRAKVVSGYRGARSVTDRAIAMWVRDGYSGTGNGSLCQAGGFTDGG